VLGALVLFHLAATLGYSARLGRLSIVPYYDDVTYLVDALDRLKAFDRDGLLGLLRTFIREPPHAPITALIAAFGFAVTPDNRLGAYALGGAWVLLILALTAYILRRLPSASRAGVFCCVLALPILSLLIGSIRPDTAWGLLTGFVATILATVNLSEASRGRLFLIGALIGLTALSKPTGMPAAISIVGLAYLGAVAITLQDPRHESIRVIVRGTARRLKLIVDGVIFQLANSLTAGLWASALPKLLNLLPVHMVLLDRGNAPDLPGMERIPFPSYGRHCHTQDSLLLDKICQLQSADVFLSTYYTTPLHTPSLSVIYDMIPERLGWALGGGIWREKELAISHGRRHLCISERTRLDLLEFYPELERSGVDVASWGVDSETTAPSAFAVEDQLGLTRPFYILMGSRIHGQDRKTFQLLFDAISRMQNVDFDVLCVGSEADLEPWSTELTRTSCRIMCAELKDRDLALAYGAAAALIYPSLYEGFAIPVLEAISRGCPVITTNLAGLAGVTASAATYLIDGNSVSQMAEAKRAVRAPEVRERLRRAGQDQAAELHRNNVVDALACNIESIHEEAENGVFTEFYSRWSKLRTLQSEVDIAT
jgi:glycosyltransferase involved in cell wall biosynthesis